MQQQGTAGVEASSTRSRQNRSEVSKYHGAGTAVLVRPYARMPPPESGALMGAWQRQRLRLDTQRQLPEWHDWRWQLEQATAGPVGLRDCGMDGASVRRVAERYPFRVTPYYLGLVETLGITDPIWRQCMPDTGELAAEEGHTGTGCEDPFEEMQQATPPGVVHRFRDRVLVTVSGTCAVYCRHCTRKNTLHQLHAFNFQRDWATLEQYLFAHSQIREVLLSGGDPLLLEDEALRELIGALKQVPTIEAIRIGTRVPVVLPMRVTDALVSDFSEHRPLWINTQFNHVRELTPEAVTACDRLIRAGLPVSNQSVILRGVNDSVEAMVALCCGLQRVGVRPYYAFLADPVKGTAHLRTSAAEAVALERAVAARVGGLALPRFVADVPGAPAKVPVRELVQQVP